MKKIYILLFALAVASAGHAQSIANAGMEYWRIDSAGLDSAAGGTGPIDTIHAPISWYGFDSIIITLGETFGPEIGSGDDWNAQIFPDSTIRHSGTYSAKIITVTQDILGNIPGVLSNAQPSVNIVTLEATMSLGDATSFAGGTPVAGRIATVSAWVQYQAGTTSAPGVDTGTMTILVYSKVYTDSTAFVDSLVGTDTVYIHPTTSWTQITGNIKYTDSVDGADTVRILFSSSNAAAVDSSTLHVDDVSMSYGTLGVQNTIAKNDVKVFPNPTQGMLYIDGAGNAGANFRLFAMNGQLVATKTLTGNNAIDISYLPDGLYFYTISDANGNVAQRGKVSVLR